MTRTATPDIRVPFRLQAHTEFWILARTSPDQPWRLIYEQFDWNTMHTSLDSAEDALRGHQQADRNKVERYTDEYLATLSPTVARKSRELRDEAATREYRIFVREVPALVPLPEFTF